VIIELRLQQHFDVETHAPPHCTPLRAVICSASTGDRAARGAPRAHRRRGRGAGAPPSGPGCRRTAVGAGVHAVQALAEHAMQVPGQVGLRAVALQHVLHRGDARLCGAQPMSKRGRRVLSGSRRRRAAPQATRRGATN